MRSSFLSLVLLGSLVAAAPSFSTYHNTPLEENPKLSSALAAETAAATATITQASPSIVSSTPLVASSASSSMWKPIATLKASPVASSSSTSSSYKPKRCSSSQASATSTSAAAASTTKNTLSSAMQSSAASLPDFWVGGNSYFLHALPQASRIKVLDAMAAANMKVVRIFISYTYANNKNSNSVSMPDVEPKQIGTYDDTQLQAIDQLMVECKARGLKLIIALHDRYALGFWSTDQYALTYGIVNSGSSGAQQKADASNFYNWDSAKLAFDHRIDYILAHKNSLLGNKKWSELDDVVYAFEPENEPMGHMNFIPTWTCDRAGRIKENLPSGSSILVSTGGGTTLSNSLSDWAFSCPAFDIISAHDYGTTVSTTLPVLQAAQSKAKAAGKTLIFEEWGASGVSKGAIITDFVKALAAAQIPHLVWEVLDPGAGASDYEIWTDESAWSAFTSSTTTASSRRMARRSSHSARAMRSQHRRHNGMLHTSRRQLSGALRARALAEVSR